MKKVGIPRKKGAGKWNQAAFPTGLSETAPKKNEKNRT